MLEKNKKRPRTVSYCSSAEEHPAHDWNTEGSTHAGWRCLGIDRAKNEDRARITQQAIKNIQKRTKESRARARRARKFMEGRSS